MIAFFRLSYGSSSVGFEMRDFFISFNVFGWSDGLCGIMFLRSKDYGKIFEFLHQDRFSISC